MTQIEVLPATKDIVAKGVEITAIIFVAVIETVTGGEWVCIFTSSGICLTHSSLHHIFSTKPIHVVDDFVIKVRVVKVRWWYRISSISEWSCSIET